MKSLKRFQSCMKRWWKCILNVQEYTKFKS